MKIPLSGLKQVVLSLALATPAFADVDVSRLPAPIDRPIDFVQDIQPIFATHCVKCHGPDKQKADYRLDVKAVALRGGDTEKPIVPGNSAKSPLIHFVADQVEDMEMPPLKKGVARLSPTEVGLLRGWIDQGAVWPDSASASVADPSDWWSFKELVRPEIPKVPEAHLGWVRNPIDAFVMARLLANDLEPSPEADRRTLIRRAYYDLTGMPPKPERVTAFLNDTDPKAYENLINELLDSPRYGERWARHWLDVVHYGDTHGYDKDKLRPNAWPYRDYVIRAFNEDKPYSRFVQEQIAGDILFPGTAEGIEALGFIAAGPWDFIGHAEVPETKIDGRIARHLDRDDMVSNTLNTFNSLTVHCAQCHNHKFDPITQEDYYSLHAVFAAVDRAEKTYYRDQKLGEKRGLLVAKQSSLNQQKSALEARIKELGGAELAALDQKIGAAKQASNDNSAPEYGYHSTIEPTHDKAKWVQIDLGRQIPLQKIVYAACSDAFNNIGDGFGFPRRYRIQLSKDPGFKTGATTIVDQTKSDAPNPGIAPLTVQTGGHTARYIRITATRLAPRQNDYIFALSELEAYDTKGVNVARGAKVSAKDSIEAPVRWRRSNLVDGIYPGKALATNGTVSLATLTEQRRVLLESKVDKATREEQARVEAERTSIEEQLNAMPKPNRVYAGTVHHGSGAFRGTGPDGGKPRLIRVLQRGDITRPGKEVHPRALPAVTLLDPEFNLKADHREGERRASLARWLTDPRHPLTWRSIVNRVWLYHFGRGIVDTPNDFGRMGKQPTHPALLDWLAATFRDGGQSIKDLHRLIVTSATYRQSSNPLPGPAVDRARAIDANNAWLWRMNRRRLEAEAIRDSVLQLSGKMDRSMYGPGFRDFVLEKPEHSPHYEYHKHDPDDAATHRRSIYRFIVRSQQQPFMTTLDCADPSMLVDKRNESLSALQALTLLNNGFMLTMANHFADRLTETEQAGGPAVERAFFEALSRPPSEVEKKMLTQYAAEHGLANTCRLLFNLNEFVFVD